MGGLGGRWLHQPPCERRVGGGGEGRAGWRGLGSRLGKSPWLEGTRDKKTQRPAGVLTCAARGCRCYLQGMGSPRGAMAVVWKGGDRRSVLNV